MSLSTKSSRDALGDRMSSQANVTFKTISLFGTHDGEQQYAVPRATCTQPCDGLIARHVAGCRWCKLIEACARRRCAPECHPQLVRSVGESPRELTGITRGGCPCRDRGLARFSRFQRDRPIPSPERWRRSRRKAGTAVHAHALEAWRHARSPVENNEQDATGGCASSQPATG
jgi:hypothetical protein